MCGEVLCLRDEQESLARDEEHLNSKEIDFIKKFHRTFESLQGGDSYSDCFFVLLLIVYIDSAAFDRMSAAADPQKARERYSR